MRMALVKAWTCHKYYGAVLLPDALVPISLAQPQQPYGPINNSFPCLINLIRPFAIVSPKRLWEGGGAAPGVSAEA